jgi:hypothetical protein
MPAAADAAPINPFPPSVWHTTLHRWTFDKGDDGWTGEHDCTVSAQEGLLKIRCTGNDPYLHHAVNEGGGNMRLVIKARCKTSGIGAIYWTTDQSPRRGEDKTAHFRLKHDGQWHEYSVPFVAPGRLSDLRIDPGQAPGECDIEWILLERTATDPLWIERVEVLPDRVRAAVRNDKPEPALFYFAGSAYTVGAKSTIDIERRLAADRPLEVVDFKLDTSVHGPLRRTLFVHHPEVKTDWIEIRSEMPSPQPSPGGRGSEVAQPSPGGRGSEVSILLARNGSMARIKRGETLVALLAPLVHYGPKLPALKPLEEADAVRFRGEGISVSVSLRGDEISVLIDSEQPCEGPVLRPIGKLAHGLFAGVEYLEQGEHSSSTLDVETPEHIRFEPDPLKVTMPLMSIITDRASLAMTWSDMQLQPVFATPNFFDCTPDHRLALRGKRIEATIQVGGRPLEETILWAVKKHGLPPLPQPPRSPQQQRELCLEGLRGPLRNESGWGHCVEPKWPRQPFADMASTLWRLSGEVPDLPRLVPGGSHLPNGAIYFVTGRARQWLDQQSRRVQEILSQQQPDGSFHYDGPYRRGHFEDTASGVCARPAVELLEYARITGDQAALAAGVRTLQYMKRFRVPRGAQVWEIPLHTPDQLASAYAVWACVRGYELTGNKELLAEARRWAASGIPFVYLWSRFPIMAYATPPVYGATNWRAPLWIGLPVQWVGGVYAYALTMLAPHDDSLDWNHLARGILLSAEQQQYPDGPNAGLLPDSFVIQDQQRNPANINPCALASLRLALEGEVDFLSVAADDRHRVAAPFLVTIHGGQARIRAKAGVTYQVLIDGSRLLEVTSTGEDAVPL